MEWKEIESNSSNVTRNLREVQKIVQNYEYRLINILVKIEMLSQKIEEILKEISNLKG